MLPNGGTPPGKHVVKSHTSYSLAKFNFFEPIKLLVFFQLNFLAADITANKYNPDFPSLSNIAFAPLARVTPLIFADSSLVFVGS